MIEIQSRLAELAALGLRGRTRLVSGPQGPHVLVDGKPVLLLCSDNYLGFADHPRLRQATADAAMRWGVGTGGSRLVAGTMTIHRRLEERLAALVRQRSALAFGSGYLAAAGTMAALARPGDVIFSDELNPPAIVDGARLSGAEVFVYDHADPEHLRWGISRAEGRGAVIASESVFSIEGDIAPLAELIELAREFGVRTVIDEAHGIGARGPEGRGAVVEAGLEDEVDVVIGSLEKALGCQGAFVACDQPTARYLTAAARTFAFATALAPPSAAGALAAVDLLQEKPHRVRRLAANAAVLRAGLAQAGVRVGDADSQILPLVIGDAAAATRAHDAALARGVLTQLIHPPAVGDGSSRLRLAVMATHRDDELRAAARTIAQAVGSVGVPPPFAAAGARRAQPEPPPGRPAVFDFEAPEPARRAA